MTLDAALSLIAKGKPIFPCDDRKRPFTVHGFKDASTDADQIRQWWTEHPDALIGMPTGEASGVVVLDIDVKAGKPGEETLHALEQEHGKLPDTVEVLTTSGGRHLYFLHPGMPVKTTSDVLGPGVDTRGDGGYVIVPPSRINGHSYEWEASNPTKPARLPQWVLDKLTERPRERPQEPGDRRADLYAGIRSGRSYHAPLARLAAHYAAKGLPAGEIITILRGLMDASEAPRDDRWHERYREISKCASSAVEKFMPAVARVGRLEGIEPAPIPAQFDVTKTTPRPFIVEGEDQRGYVSMVAGAPGVGKSILELNRGIAVALNRPKLIHGTVRESVKVWLINNEDPTDELLKRVGAIAVRHKLDVSEIRERLFLSSGYGSPFVMARKVGENVVYAPNVEEVVRHVRENQFGLLCLAPLVSIHEVDENLNREMNQVFQALGHIAKEGNCAVRVDGHIRKVGGESDSYAGDMEALRGAFAQAGALRGLFTLARMSKKSAKEMGVDADSHSRYLRYDSGKAQFLPPDKEARWYHMDSVCLDNHPDHPDSVGVPTPVFMEDFSSKSDWKSERLQDIRDAVADIFHRDNATEMPQGTVVERLRFRFQKGESTVRGWVTEAIPASMLDRHEAEGYANRTTYLLWRESTDPTNQRAQMVVKMAEKR